jgi:hypothetical protein
MVSRFLCVSPPIINIQVAEAYREIWYVRRKGYPTSVPHSESHLTPTWRMSEIFRLQMASFSTAERDTSDVVSKSVNMLVPQALFECFVGGRPAEKEETQYIC